MIRFDQNLALNYASDVTTGIERTYALGARFNSPKQLCTVQSMSVQVVVKTTAKDNCIFLNFLMLTTVHKKKAEKKHGSSFAKERDFVPTNKVVFALNI